MKDARDAIRAATLVAVPAFLLAALLAGCVSAA